MLRVFAFDKQQAVAALDEPHGCAAGLGSSERNSRQSAWSSPGVVCDHQHG
ncbi:MAG: hypothetical protein WKH64_07985 [Chloroflexia bacterium]